MSTDEALASGHRPLSLTEPVAVGGPTRGTTAGMRARAHLATQLRTTAGGGRRSCVSTLRSEAPLVLRPTRPTAAESWSAVASDAVQVSLAAGAAGPVGGDHLILEIDVGEGSSLVLSEVSPTLLLPGPHGRRSRTDVRITVAEGGTLIWLPEPVIAARACDHLNDVRVHLDDGARLLMREEVLLGRHGEPGGRVAQRVSVRLAGRPLHRQDLVHGTPVSTTPAVTGGHRAVGSVLVVDPDWVERPPTVRQVDGEAALLPLTGPAALVTALAGDNLQLRRRLAAGLAELGPPWGRNGGPTMDICTSRAPGGRVER